MSGFLDDCRLLKRLSWVQLLVVGLLLTIGVFFIHSSCYGSESAFVRLRWVKQIVWGVVGLGGYLFFAVFNYHRLMKYSVWFYGLTAVLLLAVLHPLLGVELYGARRWIPFFGILLQPSELAKLGMIAILSTMLSRPDFEHERLFPVIWILLLVAVPFGLVLVEPDLGTAMVFLPTAFLMMVVAGIRWRYLGSIAGIGLLGILLVLGVFLFPVKLGMEEADHNAMLMRGGLKEHQIKRVKVYLGMVDDPYGAEYNKIQSLIAVGSGGVWGKGYKRGTQKGLGFLPSSVAPTDFIYTVIAEEKGFVGSVVVLFLFGVVIVLGLSTALGARDKLGRLLCSGIVAMVFCHVFINIAMTVGLMPITGLPLPLLSYGGSSIVVMMAALGMIQSVYVRSRPVSAYDDCVG